MLLHLRGKLEESMRKLLIYLFPLLFITACMDEDFSSDASLRLLFSEQEVAFDTLITSVSSRTRTLMVFNANSKGIRIPLVALEKGSASPFRINVDGQFLSEGRGTDFEVPGGDSIFVRIEVCGNITLGKEIEEVCDQLIFTLESGQRQTVPLKAGLLDAELIRGLIVSSDTTFSGTRPRVFYEELVVDSNATLTLEPGTILMFHSGKGLTVNGTLNVDGTVESPVVMRSDLTEHMFKNLYYDNTPSRWNGLVLQNTNVTHRIHNLDLHASTVGIVCQSDSLGEELALDLEGSIIHNIGGAGLFLQNCRSNVRNTQISNTGGDVVFIQGGSHDFLHCTLAQFYPFSADRGQALFLEGCAWQGDEENPFYLPHVHFRNCVITGYAEDVLMGNLKQTDESPIDYLFHHCLLATPAVEDEMHYVGVIYDNDQQPTPRAKNFLRMDTELYLYDFSPVEQSPIRHLADSLCALPYDRLGHPRLNVGGPDAGCYQYFKEMK